MNITLKFKIMSYDNLLFTVCLYVDPIFRSFFNYPEY